MLITEGWLNAAYEGGRHERRVGMITRIEQRNAADVLQINSTDDTQPFTKGE